MHPRSISGAVCMHLMQTCLEAGTFLVCSERGAPIARRRLKSDITSVIVSRDLLFQNLHDLEEHVHSHGKCQHQPSGL